MLLRLSVLLAALAQVPAAALLGAGSFEQSVEKYPVYISPDSWAFSIWGLIYALSIAFAIYQALPQNDNQTLRRVRLPALIAFLGSILWLYLAGSAGWLVWLTIPVLMLMAGALCVVTLPAPLAAPRAQLLSQSFLLPYAAWTGIAQWLNIQALLNTEGFMTSGAINTASNVLLLLVIAVFSLYWLRQARYSLWYGGVIIWAVIGIIANNTGSPDGSVIIITMAGALGLAAMALVRQHIPTRHADEL